MTFNNQYARVRTPPKIMDNTRIVEDFGYVSPSERIRQLMLAGERLRTSRSVDFDTTGEPVDDSLPNVVYKPDLYDAQKMMEARAARAAQRRSLIAKQLPAGEKVVNTLSPSELAEAALEDPPPKAS